MKESTSTYIENEWANLSCTFAEMNTELIKEIKWYKNANMIAEYSNLTYLEFDRLTPTNNGYYRCQIELVNDQSFISNTVTVLVVCKKINHDLSI